MLFHFISEAILYFLCALPMRQDPKYVSYRPGKSKKFDIKNEDVLHALEQI